MNPLYRTTTNNFLSNSYTIPYFHKIKTDLYRRNNQKKTANCFTIFFQEAFLNIQLPHAKFEQVLS